MRNLNHLSEVFHSYDTYVIDLWGVMHNGIALNPKAIEVVENLSENSKKIPMIIDMLLSKLRKIPLIVINYALFN